MKIQSKSVKKTKTLKQKQKQSQNVKVIVNVGEKKQAKRKRVKRTKKVVEEEPQFYRPLPPQIYMPIPQITHYQDVTDDRPKIMDIRAIKKPREPELQDIRPLETFFPGDVFPSEKQIELVPAKSNQSILDEPKPRESIFDFAPMEAAIPSEVATNKNINIARRSEAEEEPIIQSVATARRGRPALYKYPNLDKAKREILNTIYAEEFGDEAPENWSNKYIISEIRRITESK